MSPSPSDGAAAEPQEEEAHQAPAPSPELLLRAQELLSSVELLNVRPSSISADVDLGSPPGTHVGSIQMDTALAFAAEEGVYGNRFDYKFRLMSDDPDGDPLATIEFSLLLDYGVKEGFTPDMEAAEWVTGTTGYFAAYPYARELFQSLAVRLQLDPVVLGLVKRGELRPGTIRTARSSRRAR
jgi:hypothetical protein